MIPKLRLPPNTPFRKLTRIPQRSWGFQLRMRSLQAPGLGKGIRDGPQGRASLSRPPRMPTRRAEDSPALPLFEPALCFYLEFQVRISDSDFPICSLLTAMYVAQNP